MLFKNELMEILKELSLYGDFSSLGYKVNDNTIDYLPFFRKKFKEKGIGLVMAKDIIKQLQLFYEDKNTPQSIKVVIEKIFSKMDSRDQNYRWFDRCNCFSCQFFRNAWDVDNEKFIKLLNNALKEINKSKK